jgi:hypothetical protein
MATAAMQEVRAPRDPLLPGAESVVPAEQEQEEEQAMEVMVGGSITEAIGGVAGVVLAIIGLAGVLPLYLAAIAAIAIGVALCAEGGALAATYEDIRMNRVAVSTPSVSPGE